MNFKKIGTSFLLIIFVLFFALPVQMVEAADNNLTLYEFLKSTEDKEITVNYNYPSMRLSENKNGKLLLAAHTPIIIRCIQTISTRDVISGGIVNFAVASSVEDADGNVLIKANAPVTAQINFVKTKGMIGKSGELTISDFHTTAIDGSYVPLSSSVSANGDDKMALSITLSVLICPLFLLMKGGDAQVLAGTTKTAYTISDIYIKPVKI